jgi:hypothetical protein
MMTILYNEDHATGDNPSVKLFSAQQYYQVIGRRYKRIRADEDGIDGDITSERPVSR